METAEYPLKKCREAIYNDHGMAYTCELVALHPGPCASLSIQRTVERRDAWETSNPTWRENIGQLDDVV
jgi:hypothetical protein